MNEPEKANKNRKASLSSKQISRCYGSLAGTVTRENEMVSALTAIKLLHTVIWAFIAGSILALPVAGGLRRFRWAAILTVIVLLECVVLAVNGGRCPLTDLAARYTVNRNPNFDIYLPNWLAQHNKVIFGMLFVAGELVVIGYRFWEKSGVSVQTANHSSHGANKRPHPHADA
jgi:hypothetical protein